MSGHMWYKYYPQPSGIRDLRERERMEGGSLLLGSSSCSSCCLKLKLKLQNYVPISSSLHSGRHGFSGWHPKNPNLSLSSSATGGGLCNRNLTNSISLLENENENGTASKYQLPTLDKSGRFCSPRAARELALLTVYASCLEGSDPVRLFENRLNAPTRELYCEFDKRCLLEYDHMSFGGPPITTASMEEANQLVSQIEAQSATEAEVLSAPPKLVYSKLLLRFTKKLLSTVVDRWDSHVVIIDKLTPPNWKIEPAGRILEFSILHLAMSEISGVGTRHQIVINEAVDLAKRFCDGAAPRVINGCLRTFVHNLS